MIKLIAHRGNLRGPNPQYENTVCYLDVALYSGNDIEIDVWNFLESDIFYVGHDKPIIHQSVPLRYLENPKIWVHCKNQSAYDILSKNPLVNCFQHDKEDWVKTSQGYIWVHSRWSPVYFTSEFTSLDFSDMSKFVFTWFVNNSGSSELDFEGEKYGICSDYVESYKELIK